jgi:hypothetical protein
MTAPGSDLPANKKTTPVAAIKMANNKARAIKDQIILG